MKNTTDRKPEILSDEALADVYGGLDHPEVGGVCGTIDTNDHAGSIGNAENSSSGGCGSGIGGSEYVGGLVGSVSGHSAVAGWNTGNVSPVDNVGGLVGRK